MKKLILIIIVLSFFSCSKEQEKLELFSEEAFAFYLETSWELNASARIKGFIQQEDEEDFYIAKLSYSINLITPALDTLANVDYGLIDERNPEEMVDIELDTQIEIDTAFSVGKYKIIFIVDDNLSQRTASSEKEFELRKE
jgi:hypothetical protein